MSQIATFERKDNLYMIITIYNGSGTGRTLTSKFIATILSKKYKTLLIDLNDNCNLTCHYLKPLSKGKALDIDSFSPSICDCIIGTESIVNIPVHVSKYLDVVFSNRNLYELSFDDKYKNNIYLMGTILKDIKYKYDYVVIDCGQFFESCVYCSDLVVVPTFIDDDHIRKINQTIDTIRNVNNMLSSRPSTDYKVLVCSVSNYNHRPIKFDLDIMKFIYYRFKHFNNYIRSSYKSAQLSTFVFNYMNRVDSNDHLYCDYSKIVDEIIEINNNRLYAIDSYNINYLEENYDS